MLPPARVFVAADLADEACPGAYDAASGLGGAVVDGALVGAGAVEEMVGGVVHVAAEDLEEREESVCELDLEGLALGRG
jgi:hypothetical protein